MSFLAPFMLAVGALAAAAVVALHLLTTKRPPRTVLPTARFVPISEARAVSRSSKPTDLPLLALRVLAVLLLGAAFARPVLDAPGPAVRSVVMLDASANVADRGEALRLAGERVTEGGALVVFDTTAREVPAESVADPGSASRPAPRAARGILSAAFVAAMRAGRRVARGADSVRLVLVSPLAGEEFDAATESMRAEWPGGVEVLRVAAVSDTARGTPVRLVSPLSDDPIAPALSLLPAARGAHEVRIVREGPTTTDSAWAREAGGVLVHWPLPGEEEPVADGVTAFGIRDATLVAPLVRLPLDSAVHTRDRVIARWRDGAAAASEGTLGAGCVRQVAVGVPLAGDLTLREPFTRFLSVLVEPCGGARGHAVSDSVAQVLAGGAQAASARRLSTDASADSGIAAVLLSLALAMLLVEWLVRRSAVA